MRIKQLVPIAPGCSVVFMCEPRLWRESVIALAVVCRDGETDEIEAVTLTREGPSLDAADSANFLGYETPAYCTDQVEWLGIAKLNGVK